MFLVPLVTAEAEAFADSRCCSGILTDDIPSMRTFMGYDSIKQEVLVEPEGVLEEHTQSLYFCPNGTLEDYLIFIPGRLDIKECWTRNRYMHNGPCI